MIPPLTINIFRRSVLSFHFFGTIGYFLGVFTGIGLAYYINVPIWPVLLCSIIGAGVLFGLIYLYKHITGREDLVYYQHKIAILMACALVLYLLGQPLLIYLDITLMGIGVFLVFGRIGCFSVGCCHGKPNKIGVTYSKAHSDEGFPGHLIGIKIFPIQLIESVAVLFMVIMGTYVIMNAYRPGTALLVYTVIYGLIRFMLEFYRGDLERPYWQGFSEAQWTTLAIFIVSVALSIFKVLPGYNWHFWAVIGLIVWMVITVILRKFREVSWYKIKAPQHILDIADGIAMLDHHVPVEGEIFMVRTSENINISRVAIRQNNQVGLHYTVSFGRKIECKKAKIMNYKTARIIGELIQTLRHPKTPFEIHEVQAGIFRLVFTESQSEEENQVDQPVLLS